MRGTTERRLVYECHDQSQNFTAKKMYKGSKKTRSETKALESLKISVNNFYLNCLTHTVGASHSVH